MTPAKFKATEMSWQDFREFLMAGVKDVGNAFENPEDDWTPAAFVQNETTGIGIIGIDPRFMQDGNAKDQLVSQLQTIIRETKARKFGMVLSSWALKIPEGINVEELGDADLPLASESPDRFEVLNIQVMDAERTETWTADIIRNDDGPPTLGEFKMLDVDSTSGRFVEPLQDALR